MKLEKILWGSGVICRDGLREGEFTLKETLSNFHFIKRFDYFSRFTDIELDNLKKSIELLSTTENSSYNTMSELEACLTCFEKEEIDILVLVSSPTHAPRCLRDCCNILSKRKAQGLSWSPTVMMCPSDTCYDSFSTEDVVIFEPPHLPLDVINSYGKFSLHDLGKRCLLVQRTDSERFRTLFHELLQSFGV